MSERIKVLLRLFGEMFFISLTVLGGGFAIIAAAEERLSRGDRPRKRGNLTWLKEGELLDHLPLFQALPGIIAVHAAVYIGRKVAGLRGALIAVLGAILPSVVIFILVSTVYTRIPLNHPLFVAGFTGLRAALTGVIAAMVVRCWRKNTAGIFGYPLTFLVFVAVSFLHVSAAQIILGSLAIGLVWGLFPGEKTWGQTPNRVNEMAGLLVILFIFVKYGAIAFGGGYVLVPAYFNDFVGEGARYLQLGNEEFGNMLAMTQMTPGPIGINGATFFGFRLGTAMVGGGTAGGVIGALVATLAVVLPGFVALNLALGPLAKYRGSRVGRCVETMIRPVTLGMMMSATWTFLSMCLSPVGVALTVLAFAVALSRKIGIVQLIILSAAAALPFAGII